MEQSIKYLEWYQNSDLNTTFDDILKDERSLGEKIGLKKGEKVGRKEEKLETAKNLLALKVPISIISKATKLSKNEIETIKINIEK